MRRSFRALFRAMQTPLPATPKPTANGLLHCLGLLLAIKAVWFALDPTVRVFMGDSGSYLHTALTGWIPPDRSFLYGWVIEASAVRFASAQALLVLQSIFGIASGLLLYAFLVDGLKSRHGLALCLAALFALDPAQLFYERMMMAEATGLLAFLLFFASLAAFVSSGRWYLIPVYASFGIAAVAFRINLVAVVLVLSLLAPLIVLATRLRQGRRWDAIAWAGVHLALAVGCTSYVHGAYKQWYGELAYSDPGYTANAGIFRLALVAPLIEPEHFRNTGVSPEVLNEVAIDYRDPRAREGQIWLPGGLVDVLRRHTDDADGAARKISIRAARENPLGLIRLGLLTVADYFNAEVADARLHDDLGRRAPDAGLVEAFRAHLRYDLSEVHLTDTLASRWFVLGSGWLTFCLFALAPLALLALWRGRHAPGQEVRVLLALTSLGLVTGHVLFSHIVSFRYLHPLPWFVLANVAALLTTPASRGGTPSGGNSDS